MFVKTAFKLWKFYTSAICNIIFLKKKKQHKILLTIFQDKLRSVSEVLLMLLTVFAF